ncbi:HCNGP-domain-containing protein [Meredithblackwellia eburnea MCA 4105]
MQGLASYGSDDEDEELRIGTGPPRPGHSSIPQEPPKTTPAPSPGFSQPINRIKASNSRFNSPLSGVRLPSSNASSPKPQGIGLPSPDKKGKLRESSASPPPYEAPKREPKPEDVEDEDGERSRKGNGTLLSQNGGGAVASASAPRVKMNSLSQFGVPPMVAGPCKPSVEAKLENFHNLSITRGLHFNDSLARSKAFRNPRIYQKLVEFVMVDERASNWPKLIWDPTALPSGGTAAAIALDQKLRSEARQAAQASGSRSSIAFTSSRSDDRSRGDQKSRDRERDRHRDKERDRERERDYRDRDHKRDRDRGEKRSRWDAGKRERSRSPRR